MGTNVNRTNWIRKASLLFITFIAVLFVSMYLAPETSATGFQAQYGFNITAVYGEGQNNVYQPTLGNFNHGQRVSIEISTLNGQLAVGNKYFAFYVVDGSIVTSDENEFTVTSNTKVTAVFTDGVELAAVFVDTNGDFLSIDYVNDLTAPVAPSVAELSKPGFTPVVFGQLDPISEHTVYVVSYVPTNPDAIVVINEVEYPYNAIVTLNADGPFTHWVEDGVIVSYNPTYQFTALSDRTITQATGGTAQTLVTLSDDLGLRTSEGKSSFLGQFEIADGETFVEAGIIASEVYVNNLTLDTPDVQIIASNAIQPVTNEFLRTVDSDAFAVVRGYVKTSAGVVYSQNQAVLDNSGLKIWEVYGAGGNSGATYDRDFLVIKNTSERTINLSNYYITYFSSTGTGGANTVLNDHDLLPGDYYVITFASGSNGATLPLIANQVYTTINAGASNFVFVLSYKSSTTATFSTNQLFKVVDFVGAGTASFSEGSATIAPSTTTSIKRTSNIDTNNNSIDFIAGVMDFSYLPQPEEFTATFVSNGGTEIAPYENIIQGTQITAPTAPIKTGYIFDKWYIDIDLTEEYNFSTPVNDDLILYAGWLEERIVTFFTDGGSLIDNQIVASGSKVDQPVLPPTKSGYSFEGWFVEADHITPFDFDTPITLNTTIYAKFVESNSPVESLIYSNDFETGFSAGSNYQLNNVKQGPTGEQWVMFFGTASTNQAIGGISVQFRWYSTGGNSNKWGTATTDFTLSNVSRITFDAKRASGSYNIYVEYSINGNDWIDRQTFTLSTETDNYEYDLPGEFISGPIYIRFGLTGTGSSGAGAIFDNVNVYGFPN